MANELAEVNQQAVSLFDQRDPAIQMAQAGRVADQLAQLILNRKLFTVIGGRKHVHVQGWQAAGAMVGLLPREVSCDEVAEGDYVSWVELIRVSDGAVVGRASGFCGADEKTWAQRPRYARRSMATTRATGKAYKQCLSWILQLAGYEPVPAEEMPVSDV